MNQAFTQLPATIPTTWPSILVNPDYVAYHNQTPNGESHFDNENRSGHDSGYDGSPASDQTQEPNGAGGGGPGPMPQPQVSDLYYRLALILEGQIYLHNQTREELHAEIFHRERLQKFLQQQDWDLNNWAKTCNTLYEALNSSRNEAYEYGVLLAEAHIENDRLKKVCEEDLLIPTQLINSA
ncbi:hypothetical protein DM02DRAFT_617913 [Periconia macrospinosa]|uniref:Uncharacterized protein n=1 Tax=Periconia macrospinosa TaxID=97972 RepID=A0A2V1DBD4_9PLEO|nr:hypothetical protein DM02DRAFT_617913 [Periconia macrospinosa]